MTVFLQSALGRSTKDLSRVGLGVLVSFAIGIHSAGAMEPLEARVRTVDRVIPMLDQAEKAYRVLEATRPPSVDGNADEWQQVPAIVLDSRERSGGRWNGPQDLSGSLRVMWDQRGLYFCLQVTDDVHSAPSVDLSGWETDCTQFAFDPYLDGPVGSYGQDELEYCVFESPGGPVLSRYYAGAKTGKERGEAGGEPVCILQDAEGVWVYEWAMRWELLEPALPWLLGRYG